jgi:hypothetical protein
MEGTLNLLFLPPNPVSLLLKINGFKFVAYLCHMKYFLQWIYACLLLVVFPFSAIGQEKPTDEYYEVFPTELTTRYYFSRKYTAWQVGDKTGGTTYRFEPNTTLNMGVGATYQNLTLNLAYGFDFLNPDLGQGDSKYLDLQAHMYPKKLVIDFFGQFYRCYHVANSAPFGSASDRFTVLPDMRVRKLGASVQYLFNGDKLSLRAAFLQNEWQKKSAASALLGFEMYGGTAYNEGGMLLPSLTNEQIGRYDRSRFLEFGPNAGYVATLVIKRHFFLTGSVSTNLGVAYLSSFEGGQRETYWQVRPNLFARGFAGYNGRQWSVNINYVHNRVNLPSTKAYDNTIMTGNYRFNLVYRIAPGPKLGRSLGKLDSHLKSLRNGDKKER